MVLLVWQLPKTLLHALFALSLVIRNAFAIYVLMDLLTYDLAGDWLPAVSSNQLPAV